MEANANHREEQPFLGGSARGFPKVTDKSAIPEGHVSHPFGSGQQLPAFTIHRPLSPGAGVGLAVCSAHPEQLACPVPTHGNVDILRSHLFLGI